jgi:bidirectional [NiFe] hydrogenase diaphorase subunit
MKVTIDGNEIEANFGETILDAANRSGVEIPTLCYSEAFFQCENSLLKTS